MGSGDHIGREGWDGTQTHCIHWIPTTYLYGSAGEWHGRGEPLVQWPRFQHRPLREFPAFSRFLYMHFSYTLTSNKFANEF
jgi:hypothetical protein